MKNKKLTGLLLLVVAVVWTVVIWRVMVSLGEKDGGVPVRESRPLPVLSATDSIRADYPDPFLKSVENGRFRKQSGISPSVFFTADPPPLPADPPDFLFRGRLKQGRQGYVLLESGGRREIVRVGDVTAGFRVVSAAEDSVVFVKENKRYVLKK